MPVYIRVLYDAIPHQTRHNLKVVIMSKHGTILKKGEKESRTCMVVDNVVTLHHVTRHGQDVDVVMDWGFDFTDVPTSKLMELASRSLVIDCRNAWKKQSEPIATGEEQTSQVFLVSDLLTKQKRGKTVSEKVGALVEGMSPEDIAALLKQVTAAE
ncbi:MAG: hypothetical protein COA94_04675 [Rickettsiales bacterium]|nr:MAG: hypothetical protein COA94_04675 [Rickettsiales bacterium]